MILIILNIISIYQTYFNYTLVINTCKVTTLEKGEAT